MQLTGLPPQGASLTAAQPPCSEIIAAFPARRCLLALNARAGRFWETWTPLMANFGSGNPNPVALPKLP